MIKAAFFDIDNTLYDWQQRRYIPSGIEAIKKIQSQGVKVFLCSARPYASMKDFGVFDLGIRWNGVIANAGAYATLGNRTLRLLAMDQKAIRTLVHIAKKNSLTMELVTAKSRFLIAPGNTFLDHYHGTYTDITPPVHPYSGQKVTGTLLFCPEEYDEQFHAALPNLIYYRFHPCGVDIAGEEHKKGDGIAAIMRELGLQREEALGFGDDFQDISMGESAVLVCVGNGRDEVKAAADYVCPPIAEDGLVEGLRHFGLNV